MFIKLIRFISFRIIGRNRTRRWLLKLFKLVDYDPLEVAHYNLQINRYFEISDEGEKNFLGKTLKTLLQSRIKDKLVMFDIGANIGYYSADLKRYFPSAHIHAFEPSPPTFEKLQHRMVNTENVCCINAAVGKEQSSLKIFTYADDPESELASIIPGVVNTERGRTVISFDVDVIDVDSYCLENGIDHIDFLKIDTEGYEMEVIKGAAGAIKAGIIDVIQFEFNHMNVDSRVFLKDFYNALPGFEFFRMKTDGLLPLGEYAHRNEIFFYQNIIAIKKDILPAGFVAK